MQVRRPALIAAVLTVVAQIPLHAGWLLHPGDTTLMNLFHGGHAWAAQAVGDAWWSGHWPDPTNHAGFPRWRVARFMAWPVLACAGLLHPLLSAVAVVNLATWIGPALGAAALVALARRLLPDARPWSLAIAGWMYGMAPVTLGAARSGQLENTQSWVLPWLLLAVHWGADRPRRWPLVALAWGVGVLTSPHLTLMAALLVPWIMVLAGVRGSLGSAAAAGLAVAGGWLYYTPQRFDAISTLYQPAYVANRWPELWSIPSSAADVDSLLLGLGGAARDGMVLHQPYLGLIPLAVGLWWGRERRRWAFPVILGVLLALGPQLGWQDKALEVGGHTFALPAILAKWLHLPIARAGQYYRMVLLAWLGTAGMVAGAAGPGRLAMAGVLAAVDALRCVALMGIPWPVWQPPLEAWRMWAADPRPGAVLHLPLEDPAEPGCHPVRLLGHAFHHRPVQDIPRPSIYPPGVPALNALEEATRERQPIPPPRLYDLGRLGFRYVVLDERLDARRVELEKHLEQTWGPPTGQAEGLSWWVVDASPVPMLPPPGPMPAFRLHSEAGEL